MRMKARRNLVPAMAAMAGLCWGMTARAQEGPAITTNPLTVRGQYPGNQEPATSRFRPYGTMKTGQPDLSSNFTPKGFVNPTAMPGGDDDLTNVQETTPGLPRVVPALPPTDPYSIPKGGMLPNTTPHDMAPQDDKLAPPGHHGIGPCPRELTPTSLPPYTIAPPDILYLDANRLIPKPPYRVEALEILLINVTNTLPNQPIVGQFVVTPEGTINLGYNYGSVRVGGLTLEQVQTAIRTKLEQVLRNPQVTVALAQFRGLQQVRGQHLIRPDGTISLGTYGSVYVAGLTLGQAKCVIEQYLGKFLLDPEISVDVLAYNSKVYYVIFDGGGFGQKIYRLPVTGNETVMDAIGMVGGLNPVSSKKRIWLARPAPADSGCSQILPVDWQAITMGAQTRTNYQIFPGDRIYVSANLLIQADNYLSMLLRPVERVLGVTLLGTVTAQTIHNFNNVNNGVFIP